MRENLGAVERQVSIETEHGTVEGSLFISPMLRTLDDLNMDRKFLTLQAKHCQVSGWSFRRGEMLLNKNTILTMRELGPPPDMSAGRPAGARFTRASVRLQVGPYQIEGFMHVPPGGSVMARLNQSGAGFLSVTSASVVGPASQFAAPFLAVSRLHILAAQASVEGDADTADAEAHEASELTFEVGE